MQFRAFVEEMWSKTMRICVSDKEHEQEFLFDYWDWDHDKKDFVLDRVHVRKVQKDQDNFQSVWFYAFNFKINSSEIATMRTKNYIRDIVFSWLSLRIFFFVETCCSQKSFVNI